MERTLDPPKRSAGALKRRRVQQPWPNNREFRILSIDGGGIRGIFPATFLAELERHHLGGASVAQYFDLIAGTSTGGIIALGLAAGLTSAELADLYIQRGCEIFPPARKGLFGKTRRWMEDLSQFVLYRYDRKALMAMLNEILGEKKFGQARNRLCVPSFDGRYGEVYIFKTPHHPDFRKDGKELMTKVAAATAAAPTFFQPLEDGGYTFVDGGVWANNPVMVALVDVLSCFDVACENVRILSLGCGDDPYVVGRLRVKMGGLLSWWNIMFAAMRLQSLNALGQAGLLIGAHRIIRADAPSQKKKIRLDDWMRAKSELPGAAEVAVAEMGDQVAEIFLKDKATPYEPVAQWDNG